MASEGAPKKKFNIDKEVRAMLWGFGDDVPDPNDCLPETIQAIEDCVLEYINTTVHIAAKTREEQGAGNRRIVAEDILKVVEHDSKKHNRVRELLQTSKELKQARKAFEDAEGDAGGGAFDEDEDDDDD